jgi:hypothetical protein
MSSSLVISRCLPRGLSLLIENVSAGERRTLNLKDALNR